MKKNICDSLSFHYAKHFKHPAYTILKTLPHKNSETKKSIRTNASIKSTIACFSIR